MDKLSEVIFDVLLLNVVCQAAATALLLVVLTRKIR